MSSLVRHCVQASLACISLALSQTLYAAPSQQEPDWDTGGTLHINRSFDSHQDITLQRPLSLNVGSGHTVRLHGLITSPFAGLHTLDKDGTGRLELWGENTGVTKYLRLRAGTLHVGHRYALGDDVYARLHIHPGSTLSYEAGTVVAATLLLENQLTHTPEPGVDPNAIQWRVDRGTATHIGPIHGNTPMVKQGAGSLWLRDGNNSPGSRLSIAQGAVQLDSLFAGTIDIHHQAMLTGGGRAGSIMVSPGGILAPSGQINVDHTLHFQPDSQLHIRAWADGQHDRINVLYGSAQLDGHVVVLPQGQANDWEDPVEAVIVQTRDGIGNSRFASVESALPYLEPELRYTENNVHVLLRPRTIASVAQDVPPGIASGWAASVRNQLIDDSRFMREAVYARADAGGHKGANHDVAHNHLRGHRGASSSHTSARQNFRFWTQGLHSSGKHRGSHVDGGLHRHINGVLLGLEYDINPRWRAGFYGGASRTQIGRPSSAATHHALIKGRHGTQHSMPPAAVDNHGLGDASATVDTTHLGLYAHHTTPWGSQVTAGLAHSWHRVHSRRTAITPAMHDNLNSRYNARTAQVFGQLQHLMWTSPDRSTFVSPFARLAWVHARQNAHTEHGGPLSLTLPSDDNRVLFSSVGIKLEKDLALPRGNARLQGSLAWRHAAGDTNSAMRHTFRDDVLRNRLSGSGIAIPRHAWTLQLGMQANISKQTQLDVEYSGQYGTRLQDHGVRLGMVIRW